MNNLSVHQCTCPVSKDSRAALSFFPFSASACSGLCRKVHPLDCIEYVYCNQRLVILFLNDIKSEQEAVRVIKQVKWEVSLAGMGKVGEN